MHRALAFIALPLLGLGLGAAPVWPALVHTFDRGHQTLTVAELPSTTLVSRKLTLVGRVRTDMVLAVGADRSCWPFVPEGWEPGRTKEPVRLVACAAVADEHLVSSAELQAAPLDGVLHDVAWETVEPEVRDELEAGGQPVASDAKRFELGEERSTAYRFPMVGFIAGLSLAFALGRRAQLTSSVASTAR